MIRLIALVGGLLLLAGEVAFAQGKIAYVSSEAILEKLSDAKSARARLNELQQTWLREIEKMENEIDKLRGDIAQNRLLWSAQEKRDADARLVDLMSKLATFRAGKFGPTGEFTREQEKLMGPVIEKVQKAIEEEARAQKYDIVLDKSNRGTPILYANTSVDITVAVLKRLGVDTGILPVSLPIDVPSLNNGGSADDEARRNRSRRATPTDTSTTPPPTADPNTMLVPDPVEQPK